MAPGSPRLALSVALQAFEAGADEIRLRQSTIHREMRQQSRHVRDANFTSINSSDLTWLFDAYDRSFLDGRCRPALQDRHLSFRLSRRMTSNGGTTTQWRSHLGVSSYEIAIAIGMLFDAFGTAANGMPHRPIRVCGLECLDRLEALQRIFEHELIHLAENLVWGATECSAARFQDIARRLFLHRSHKHELITRREKAAQSGIRVGSRVAFEFEGRRLEGRVNRVTQRATILVEHPEGIRYSDGHRYRKYYVPLAHLERI
jgi:hypothetical protein